MITKDGQEEVAENWLEVTTFCNEISYDVDDLYIFFFLIHIYFSFNAV